MELGDFTDLAAHYHNRAGYSKSVLEMLGGYVLGGKKDEALVSDVGAGTGKLTENLLECGFRCVAVEPNDAMRTAGIEYTKRFKVEWKKGSGEETGLGTSSSRWLLMGSSFHWVDTAKGLAEFHRVLQPGGCFTALWNPRDIESSQLHTAIENHIYRIAPGIKRVSSGSSKHMEGMTEKLVSTGHFEDPIFVEGRHQEIMAPERYLGAWRSVNDIQAQAGPEKFAEIMTAIEKEISGLKEIAVPYKTRSWTARRKG